MTRQARLDAPGTLHHVMARGIEGTNIFRTDKDWNDFLDGLAAQCEAKALKVYAWAFIPNHFHLLVRTGNRPIFASMRKILTGYVVRFNRRHQRQGHLFQNRYKSIVCEEDPYLLELTRYIHLNPLTESRDCEDGKRTGEIPLEWPFKDCWNGEEGVAGYRGDSEVLRKRTKGGCKTIHRLHRGRGFPGEASGIGRRGFVTECGRWVGGGLDEETGDGDGFGTLEHLQKCFNQVSILNFHL